MTLLHATDVTHPYPLVTQLECHALQSTSVFKLFKVSVQILGVHAPDPVNTELLQGPSLALNFPQESVVPVNAEHALG